MFSALGSILGSVGSIGASIGVPIYMANRQNSANLQNAYEMAYFQQEMQAKNDLERPSRLMQGFRRAGLNPLLALGSFGGNVAPLQSVPSNNISTPDVVSSARQGSMIANELKMLKADADRSKSESEIAENQKKISDAEVSAATAEALERVSSARKGKQLNDLEYDLLTDTTLDYPNYGKGKPSADVLMPEYTRRLRESKVRALDRLLYEGSREHAIYEDVLKGVDTSASALSEVLNGVKKPPKSGGIHINNIIPSRFSRRGRP